MPVPRARQITLAAAERRRLKRLAYSYTAPYQLVIRVRIVLDAARGYSNAKIARGREVSVDTVRLWRGRYADEGMKGLADRVGAEYRVTRSDLGFRRAQQLGSDRIAGWLCGCCT